MTIDQAIYILCNTAWLGSEKDRESMEQAVIMAVDALERRKWIPCTPETMPEEDGDYLVTYEKGYAEDYGFDLVGIAPFEVDCEGFGIWQEHFDLQTFGSRGSDWVDIPVIAWCELPAPYQPKEDES